MKIAIIGYGRMGKAVEVFAKAAGHEVGLIIDVDNTGELRGDALPRLDVAIEFSVPSAAFGNISACFDAGIPVVSGTTGWNDGLKEIRDRCEREGRSLVYASNFSIGVNLLFHINGILAGFMNRFPQYDVSISETHHTGKKDAPSGTAITLAESITEQMERKDRWFLKPGNDGPGIPVEAVRKGGVTGIHEVRYEGPQDILSLRHEAKDRQGFVTGAVLAAEFIRDKKGCYGMQDVLLS